MIRFYFLALFVFLGSTFASAEVILPPTKTSNSVQALIWKALFEVKKVDEASPYPQGLVKNGDKGELIIEDPKSKVSCVASSVGMLPVQNYSCKITHTEMRWTRSSDSVQSVLWDGLRLLKEQDDQSPYPNGHVVSPRPGILIVEDDYSRLTCESAIAGSYLNVQKYRCQLRVF